LQPPLTLFTVVTRLLQLPTVATCLLQPPLFFIFPTIHSSPTSSNSSGQGSNGQDVGVSCPLSDVGRNPNMEQPKGRYMEKTMKKKEKTKNICTL